MNTHMAGYSRLLVLAAVSLVPGAMQEATAAPKPEAAWVLDADHVDGSYARAVAGDRDAKIVGNIAFDGDPSSLSFDGASTEIIISGDIAGMNLPTEAFTVEAWASVHAPLDWGGFIGAIQDNDPVEKGWLLGYRDSTFCFGLSTAGADDGDGKMTYLEAEKPFALRRWYHVAGLYDGAEMRIYVDGELAGRSDEQSGRIIYPEKARYVIGAYHDDDELFRLRGNLLEVRWYDRALPEPAVRKHFEARQNLFPGQVRLALGPYLRFTAPGTAEVAWRTTAPMPTSFEFDLGDKTVPLGSAKPAMNHRVELTGLGRNTVYRYRIILGKGKKASKTEWYECDTMFNYSALALPEGPPPYAEDELTAVYVATAQRILADTGITKGYAVVLGSGHGRLAYELANRSDFYVVGVDTDAARVAAARERFQQAGAYGPRLTVRHVPSYSELPFSNYFANLIVSDRVLTEGRCVGDAKEVHRVLRPSGGVVYLGSKRLERDDLDAWFAGSSLGRTISETDQGCWVRAYRKPLDGVGEWSHQYGSPDNSAQSGDTLLGASGTDELEALWVGRPGPRAMVDRNPRGPAPLYMNGRLFTQGLHRIIAQDAYNGAIFWSLEIPHLERFNMPRDSANWCADDDFVYTVVRDACWRLDAQTGDLARVYGVAPKTHDWGYVAQAGSLVYGSAVKRDTPYTNFWGKNDAGWYDSPTGPVTNKVCSDALFALAKDSGDAKWAYSDGVIINPTITMAEGRVFFVECRHPAVKASASGRVGLAELWSDQFLVALDAVSGEKVWEKAIDTTDGTVIFYMIHANDRLIIATSDTQYNLHAFDDESGEPLWDASHGWTGVDHSGHMQHPCVVGNTVYLEPCGYDIASGERVTDAVGRHGGCATYAGTENALIFRGPDRRMSMWNVDTAQTTNWTRLRPACWLSTIAGGGMVLSPEGGGGCSCGNWMETSLAFARRRQP